MSDASEEKELSPWVAIPGGLLIFGFPTVMVLSFAGYLSDTVGAVCIGIFLLMLAVVVIGTVVGWLRRVGRATNNVIDRNDPKSPHYRS